MNKNKITFEELRDLQSKVIKAGERLIYNTDTTAEFEVCLDTFEELIHKLDKAVEGLKLDNFPEDERIVLSRQAFVVGRFIDFF